MSDLWARLLTYQRHTLRQMNEHLVDRTGHTLDDYDVLHQVAMAGEPLRIGDLAERLLVANSSCNRIVRRLAEQGLVSHAPGDTDARTRMVGLTTQGRRTYRRLAAVHGRDIAELFTTRLTPDQSSAFADAIDALAADQPSSGST